WHALDTELRDRFKIERLDVPAPDEYDPQVVLSERRWMSHRRCLGDRGVAAKDFFNLPSRNILASAPDDVLVPSLVKEVAIIVLLGEIPRMKPKITKGGCCGFWLVEVALHQPTW